MRVSKEAAVRATRAIITSTRLQLVLVDLEDPPFIPGTSTLLYVVGRNRRPRNDQGPESLEPVLRSVLFGRLLHYSAVGTVVVAGEHDRRCLTLRFRTDTQPLYDQKSSKTAARLDLPAEATETDDATDESRRTHMFEEIRGLVNYLRACATLVRPPLNTLESLKEGLPGTDEAAKITQLEQALLQALVDVLNLSFTEISTTPQSMRPNGSAHA